MLQRRATTNFQTATAKENQNLRHQKGQQAGHSQQVHLRTDCTSYMDLPSFCHISQSGPLTAAFHCLSVRSSSYKFIDVVSREDDIHNVVVLPTVL